MAAGQSHRMKLLLLLLSPAVLGGDNVELLEYLEMEGLECYQCAEDPLNKHMSCDLQPDNFQQVLTSATAGLDIDSFMEEIQELEEDGGSDQELIQEFFHKYAAILTNPCKMITKKVLEMLEGEELEGIVGILPTYKLQTEGKDEKGRYKIFKSLIRTIQFQKREQSELVAVEMNLREGDDPLAFILQENDPDFEFIPYGLIFYTAL